MRLPIRTMERCKTNARRDNIGGVDSDQLILCTDNLLSVSRISLANVFIERSLSLSLNIPASLTVDRNYAH